jgi:uncharacterized protein YjbJ (UPF0337 family)
MGNATRRSKGAAKELGGKVERKVGRAVGSERDEKESAKARERVKGKVEEAVGAVQRGAGRLLDDDETRARGALRNARGKLRQKANR